MAAMTDLAVFVARPVEQGILLGSALHRSGFPRVGPQGYKIGGDDPQHFGPKQQLSRSVLFTTLPDPQRRKRLSKKVLGIT